MYVTSLIIPKKFFPFLWGMKHRYALKTVNPLNPLVQSLTGFLKTDTQTQPLYTWILFLQRVHFGVLGFKGCQLMNLASQVNNVAL